VAEEEEASGGGCVRRRPTTERRAASGSVGRFVRELETFLWRPVTRSGERGRCSDAGAGRQPRDGRARGVRGRDPGGPAVAAAARGRGWPVPTGIVMAAAPGAFEELHSAVATARGGRAASNSGSSVPTVRKPAGAGRPFVPRSRAATTSRQTLTNAVVAEMHVTIRPTGCRNMGRSRWRSGR